MEVIVLAGGMGTRLRSVVSDLPKPMAPVNNKPFIEYVFRWLVKYPVSRIILSVGYKAQVISDYFGNSYQSIPIIYVEEPQPLGTGGAVKFALNQIVNDEFLIVNADTYFPVDLALFQNFHDLAQSKLSIALKKMSNFDRYGTVELKEDTILNFHEKKFCEEGLINGGIYMVKKDFINSLPLPEIFSFEKEVLEKHAVTGNLKGIAFTEPFIDIGIPEDYYRASEIV